MKFIQLFILSLVLFSCRGESESDIQKIDQILKIYIKDASGKDLLNKAKDSTFYSIEFKDLGALQDRVSVRTSLKVDKDSVYYHEYIAGATRTLEDGGTDTNKTYKSDIAVQYKTSTTSEIVEDRMLIFYDWTPQIFQIKSVFYNDSSIFQKEEGKENIITIVK